MPNKRDISGLVLNITSCQILYCYLCYESTLGDVNNFPLVIIDQAQLHLSGAALMMLSNWGNIEGLPGAALAFMPVNFKQ